MYLLHSQYTHTHMYTQSTTTFWMFWWGWWGCYITCHRYIVLWLSNQKLTTSGINFSFVPLLPFSSDVWRQLYFLCNCSYFFFISTFYLEIFEYSYKLEVFKFPPKYLLFPQLEASFLFSSGEELKCATPFLCCQPPTSNSQLNFYKFAKIFHISCELFSHFSKIFFIFL